jgi:hypothetical protein
MRTSLSPELDPEWKVVANSLAATKKAIILLPIIC